MYCPAFFFKKNARAWNRNSHVEFVCNNSVNRFISFERYNFVSESSPKVTLEPNLQHRVGKHSKKSRPKTSILLAK